uniref:apolipoprotein A-V n=1 Tax=Lonchura striata TaxID=40157 RepID=UPI000B4CC575
MLPRAALLLWLLAACPGGRGPGRAAAQAPLPAAVPAGKAAQGGLREHRSQLTGDKDSREHGKLGRDTMSLKESTQDGVSHTGGLLQKLSPLRPHEDSAGLRKAIRRELDGLRLKLAPYVDEAQQQVGKQLEELRQRLRPLAEELLEEVSLRARELRRRLLPDGAEELQRFLARYGDEIALHTEQAKDIFQPHAQRLLSEIRRNVRQLHRGVAPHARAGPEQLGRHIQELSAELTRGARDLHRRIQRNLEQLQAKLSPRPGGLGGRSREALAREVQRRVEEFRRDTYAQIQAFARVLDRETEEMRLKLSARPEPPEEPLDAAPSLEDLRARLDALWRDLALSLSERGGDGPGGPGDGPGGRGGHGEDP